MAYRRTNRRGNAMSWWTDLLQGIPLNAVLKERLALAEQKFNALEKENKELRGQVEALTAENASLKEERDSLRTEEEFVERRGVAWKKEPDGHYLPCCPKCKTALSKIPPWKPDTLKCSSCKFVAPFHPREVAEIAKSLSK
jgi:hypothetical protein